MKDESTAGDAIVAAQVNLSWLPLRPPSDRLDRLDRRGEDSRHTPLAPVWKEARRWSWGCRVIQPYSSWPR
jgi:hypothetical protein